MLAHVEMKHKPGGPVSKLGITDSSSQGTKSARSQLTGHGHLGMKASCLTTCTTILPRENSSASREHTVGTTPPSKGSTAGSCKKGSAVRNLRRGASRNEPITKYCSEVGCAKRRAITGDARRHRRGSWPNRGASHHWRGSEKPCRVGGEEEVFQVGEGHDVAREGEDGEVHVGELGQGVKDSDQEDTRGVVRAPDASPKLRIT